MEKRKRNTMDLIMELHDEGKKFLVCAIVVGFKEKTEFVWYDRKMETDLSGVGWNLVNQLQELMKAGGEPIGLIGWGKPQESEPGSSSRIYHRVFEELAGEAWVEEYLDRLERTIVEAGMAAGVIEGATKIGRG